MANIMAILNNHAIYSALKSISRAFLKTKRSVRHLRCPGLTVNREGSLLRSPDAQKNGKKQLLEHFFSSMTEIYLSPS